MITNTAILDNTFNFTAQGGIRTPVAREGAWSTATCNCPLCHLRECYLLTGTNF